ncbi:putative methyltransferase-like protein 24, partial [Saccoglossus kowalevskii]
MNLGSHKHSERVWFFDFGLLDVNSNGYYGTGMKANTNSIWKVRTLEGLMAEMNHQHKVIDVLKIDIEGAEWSSLHNMLEEGILHYVKQLVS